MRTCSLTRAALALSCLSLPRPLTAQPGSGAHRLCWRAAPKPSCNLVILTNVGLYGVLGSIEKPPGFDPATGLPTDLGREVRVGARAVGDWGLLLNLGRRDAVGFSALGSIESTRYGHQAELAGFVRYRRYFGRNQSLDLALGTPVILGNSASLRSPYGLVKLNLSNQLGVALRPELRRSYIYSTAPPHKGSRLFLSAGIEMGEKPGFALSALGAVLLGLRTLIAIHNSD